VCEAPRRQSGCGLLIHRKRAVFHQALALAVAWLSFGVEPQLVAHRAGQSVAVLFRFYAKFLRGGDDEANAKISARLAQWRARS